MHDDVAVPATLKQLQQIFTFDDYFGRLMAELSEAAADALGENVRAQNMQYFNKPPRCAYAASSVHAGSQPTPSHQDGFYWCHERGRESGVTMWLALDDADEETGCLRYVAGSARGPIRPHDFSGVLGFSQTLTSYSAADRGNEVVMRARAGDLLIHNAFMVHRADANASETRTRRAIGAIFYGESAVVDEAAAEGRRAEIARRAALLKGQQQR